MNLVYGIRHKTGHSKEETMQETGLEVRSGLHMQKNEGRDGQTMEWAVQVAREGALPKKKIDSNTL